MKHTHLYLWLVTLMFKTVKKERQGEDQKVLEKIAPVFDQNFLNQKGKRYCDKIQMAVRHYANYLIESERPIMGIAKISKAIQACRQSEEQVSSLHTSFAMLCLKAKCFQHSLMIIDHHITSVMKGTHALEIMTYNYYRGLLYTGL